MLRAQAPHSLLQDENAGAAPSMLPTVKQALSGPAEAQKGSTIAWRQRVALGNISNMALQRPGPDSLGDSKSSAKPVRRALGDITNAQPVQSKAVAHAGKPARWAASTSQPGSATAHGLAEQLAAEGVEKLAGKSWAMQEGDRRQQEATCIAARVKVFTQMPVWRPYVVSAQCQAWLLLQPLTPCLRPCPQGPASLNSDSSELEDQPAQSWPSRPPQAAAGE
jgi:hypothetical protein